MHTDAEACDALERVVKIAEGLTCNPSAFQSLTDAREALRILRRQPRPVREVIWLSRMRGPGLARLKAAPRVLIQSDNGFWRADAAGYCYEYDAAVYTGEDAWRRTNHCGPEKRVRYHVLKP